MGRISHYVVTVTRSLRRHWLFSCISALGMSAAFSLSLISAAIIWHAYSSDSHWEDASQIYVLDRRVGNNTYYRIPAGFLQDLKNFSAAILQVASTSSRQISYKRGSRVGSRWIQQLDGNFVEMFPLETSSGDFASTLRRHDAVALSEETAHRLYGEKVAVGQVFEEVTDGVSKIYTVGAVYAPRKTRPRSRHRCFCNSNLVTMFTIPSFS